MAAESYPSKIYYEIRYKYSDSQSEVCDKCDSLEEAWLYYKNFIVPTIKYYKDNKDELTFIYYGCFRCKEISQVNFNDYSDSLI